MIAKDWLKLRKCTLCNKVPNIRCLADTKDIRAVWCMNKYCKAKGKEYSVNEWQSKGISLL